MTVRQMDRMFLVGTAVLFVLIAAAILWW